MPVKVSQSGLEIVFQLLIFHKVDPKPGKDADLLFEWLIGHPSTIEFQMTKPWEVRAIGENYPDICCECTMLFGRTPSGRIRRGCPVCRSKLGSHILFSWARYTGTAMDSPAFFEVANKYLYPNGEDHAD